MSSAGGRFNGRSRSFRRRRRGTDRTRTRRCERPGRRVATIATCTGCRNTCIAIPARAQRSCTRARSRSVESPSGNVGRCAPPQPGDASPQPEATGSVHGRLVIAGVAAGAIAAGANTMVKASEVHADPRLIADAAPAQGDSVPDAAGMQNVQVASSLDSAVHQEELARGALSPKSVPSGRRERDARSSSFRPEAS